MGKAGRIACISLPLVLTFASLICLFLVGLGGTNKNDGRLASIYFFRADTKEIHAVPNTLDSLEQTVGKSINQDLSAALSALKHNNSGSIPLNDFYTVSLWGYCTGNTTEVDGKNVSTIDTCSKPAAQYWFDPVTVWGLNSTGAASLFPKQLAAGLSTYRLVARWMYIAYIAAFVFTVLELICGLLAVFSRWGSLATTIMSSLSSTLVLLASITASALYATLAATFNTVLKQYGIQGTVGHNALVITWLAVAFSWGAGLFWLFSTCCCSGRSNNKAKRGRKSDALGGGGEKGYERVGSPYMGAGEHGNHGNHAYGAESMPLHTMGPQQSAPTKVGGGYEPYRHANV